MPSGGQTLTFYFLALVVTVLVWLATHLVGKPLLAYRAIRADIARCLVLYANVPSYTGAIDTPLPPRTHQAQVKYRELASELVAFENTITFYHVWAACKIIPARKDLDEAKRNLIGLSNSVGERDQYVAISKRENNIQRLLRIKLPG